ncbi:SYG2-like protein [Mya arenaria]|uniref:SYG2-like protein n=1 Tax=Mya arenaria TaxID=6604 RepID=A0ABY7EBY5_MYAAR|nr:SYG2-like protein [Mya arenaria]
MVYTVCMTFMFYSLLLKKYAVMLIKNLNVILFVYRITYLATGITLSGNGKSKGFTVLQNASLQLTCSTSIDVQNVTFLRRYLNKSPDQITTVGYGSSGCGTDPTPPSYLNCSCVSRKEYACDIRNVTIDMNGDIWFCQTPRGNTTDESGDKIIIVTNVATTLSGNGTSGEFTVQEHTSLQMTCFSTTDVQYVTFHKRYLDRAPDTITAVGYGSLGCGTDPKPPSYLSCSCVSRREYVCVIRSVTRAMNGDVWFCSSPAEDSNDDTDDRTIVVTIRLTSVSMIIPAGSSVSVIENTDRQFRCETSAGKPKAIVEWYKDNGTPDRADDTQITTRTETESNTTDILSFTSGKLTLTVQRDDREVGVYCRANNDGFWIYSFNEVSTPKVLYKASEVNSTVRVISGRSMTLICSSTGNPNPTYTWTYPGGGSHTGPSLTLDSVQAKHIGVIMCTTRNRLAPTGGVAVIKTPPPGIPSCYINGTSISTTVIIPEGTNRTINCTSSANPPQITYTWSTPGRGQVSRAALSLNNVQHPADQGQYTLTVTNTMDPTGGSTETGISNTTFIVDVQFAPRVNLPQSYDIFEGTVLNYSCSFIPGNPSQTLFVWRRLDDGRKWNSQFLSLTTVNKSDDDYYICTATNQLTPTGLSTQTGTQSGTMHLNSSVAEFHVSGYNNSASVTQMEKISTLFTCTVDSNPPSTIKILKDGEIRRFANNSNQLEYTIANPTCMDAGLYTCDASNQFNIDTPSARDVRLFVTCSPRRPPGKDIKLNFTAQLHDNYTVVAYPVPIASQFVWKRCFGRNICVQLFNISTKFEITTNDSSSNFTIMNTDIDDFGVYSLSVKNGIGDELVEDFLLQSIGPPDTPTGFNAISNTVTSSSAVLSWIPGSNNGSPQTFRISYRVLDTLADWHNVTIQHNGETEMNVTLDDLEPGRSYFVECNALNIAGESAKKYIIFSTPTESANFKPQVVAIAGGVTAGVLTLLVIVVVLCVLRRKLSTVCRRNNGSTSSTTIYGAEDPGYNAAVTYETISAKNNTLVYDALSAGNDGAETLHVYMPLNESTSNTDQNYEKSKTKDPVYDNTMQKDQVQTVI